jgi:DNA-binding transcriptional ArsR family regulator
MTPARTALQARRFAALGDPTRLQVFTLIARSPLSVAEVAARLPVSRPAVSQHLKVLAEAGLVQRDSVGTRNLYRPDPDGIASLRDFVAALWDAGLARFKAQAEALARPRPPPRQGEEMNTLAHAAQLVVRKSVTVAAPVAVAFEVFTARIESWWPLTTHHIGEADCAAVVIEPYPGGRWFERGVDGIECVWGHVLLWEPDRRVVLVWQLNARWQFDPEFRTEVDVRFTAVDERTTRVDLEHRGLEAYGADAMTMRDVLSGGSGWTGMLDHFAEVAGARNGAAQG